MMGTEEPQIVAHRGFAAEFPENSISAVRNACQYADGVEIDVRCCGSGELVAAHDPWIGPLWARKPIDRCSWSELSAITATETADSIARISELIAAATPDTLMVFELKDVRAADRLVTVVDDLATKPIVSSSSRDALATIASYNTDVLTAFVHMPSLTQQIMGVPAKRIPQMIPSLVDIDSIVEEAIALECDEVHLRYELCLHTDIVDRAHANDLSVAAWTVRSAGVYRELADRQVDRVIADTWRFAGGRPNSKT